MTLEPGDILFTSLLTSVRDGVTNANKEVFSFVATKDIAAGTQITFHDFDAVFTYTVGASGLNRLDVVVVEELGNVITLLQDPSGGSAGPSSGTFSLTSSQAVLAGSNGSLIAGIHNDVTQVFTDDITVSGLDDTAYIALPRPLEPDPMITTVSSGSADNTIYDGPDLIGLGTPANWSATDTPVFVTDVSDVDVGGTTYASQSSITCFLAGTFIATPDGETRVEDLRPGDLIATADGRAVPALWIGRQTVSKLRHGARADLVRVRAGAFGDGLPYADLCVTADHGLLLDGFVINASALVNGDSINWVPLADLRDSFMVYHVETDDHDAILANGEGSESFVDVASRRNFDNYAEYLARYGHERIIPAQPFPRVSSARLLPQRIRQRLQLGQDLAIFG